MDTIEDTASDWLDHLRVERGASAHTVSNYRRDIRRYARDLGARGITDIAGVRAADIEAHLAALASGALTGAPAAPASVARASAAIRGLHAYALRQGRVGADAAAEVHAFAAKSEPTPTTSASDLEPISPADADPVDDLPF